VCFSPSSALVPQGTVPSCAGRGKTQGKTEKTVIFLPMKGTYKENNGFFLCFSLQRLEALVFFLVKMQELTRLGASPAGGNVTVASGIRLE